MAKFKAKIGKGSHAIALSVVSVFLLLLLVVSGALQVSTISLDRNANPVIEFNEVSPSPTSAVQGVQNEQVRVVKVIDGDTIELEGGMKVRYIGVDTPESTTQRECFGKESTQRNKDLVEGRIVRLEKDISETDRYGRILRYVFIEGVSVNEKLVREGYAQSSAYPPDVKYQDKFDDAEREAREERRGLWGTCLN